MTVTVRARSGLAILRSTAAAVTLLVVAAAGCAVGARAPAATPDLRASLPAASATTQRIVLRFDRGAVAATLADTSAGREFAALLPLTVDLHDPMGQAKAGRLPTPIHHTGAASVTDPEVGGLYYVPGSGMLAIFYDDLGQAVPPPGLVRLGAVDDDLDTIAAAGNRTRVRIDLTDRTNT